MLVFIHQHEANGLLVNNRVLQLYHSKATGTRLLNTFGQNERCFILYFFPSLEGEERVQQHFGALVQQRGLSLSIREMCVHFTMKYLVCFVFKFIFLALSQYVVTLPHSCNAVIVMNDILHPFFKFFYQSLTWGYFAQYANAASRKKKKKHQH